MRQTITKQSLDRRLRRLVGDDVDIPTITEQLFFEMMEELLRGNEVYIRGFGTFKVSIRKGKRGATASLTNGTGKKGEVRRKVTVKVKRKFYVSFRRAAGFREKFRERFSKKRVKP